MTSFNACIAGVSCEGMRIEIPEISNECNYTVGKDPGEDDRYRP